MRIEPEIKLDYKDVLFKPKRSTLYSRSEVDLNRKFHFKNSQQLWQGIPIIASNMDSTGTFEIAKALSEYKLLTCLHKFYTPQEIADFFKQYPLYEYTAITVGIQKEDIQYLEDVIKLSPPIKWICVDIANGYTERFVNCVKSIRQKYLNKIIIAGNVVTSEMVEELILTGGADIVKVGIGPGSVCTTRIQTGVGYPQLSAVIECADAAHGVGGCVVADGGCVIPGDVAKAFGGGADFVMLGGMLAGHDESGGEIEEIDGKKYKTFYGMSSDTAMKKYYGQMATYRSSEGKTIKLPYKGSIHDTIQSILGGVRSTCTYIGARNLKNMSKCTTFIRVSQQSNEVFGKNI